MKRVALLFLLIISPLVPLTPAQNTFPNTGNVGIGTTDPKGALHILRSGAPPTGLSEKENATPEENAAVGINLSF